MDWNEIGMKSGLQDLLVEITRIHSGVLFGQRRLNDFSIAQRMSWASLRETTRHEDIDYCLMRIFDVNMPLLYVEGSKAFLRLPVQILNTAEDDSILAWTVTTVPRISCLASSPKAFATYMNIVGN